MEYPTPVTSLCLAISPSLLNTSSLYDGVKSSSHDVMTTMYVGLSFIKSSSPTYVYISV